jgi:cytochrome c oxidase assembly factor CtaG
MVQHLLMTMVAAPLLLVSRSMPVMLWALPTRDRVTIGRLVGRPGPVRGVLQFLTHPIIAWTLYLVVQWLWHMPAAYQLALTNRWVHYAEHLTFFGSAMLFWWPVIGAAPLGSRLTYPARLLYTFLAWIPNTILGAGLTFAPTVLYPIYAERAAPLGIDPLSDQTLAGLLMWIPGDILFVAILLLLLYVFLQQEDRAMQREEALLDRPSR